MVETSSASAIVAQVGLVCKRRSIGTLGLLTAVFRRGARPVAIPGPIASRLYARHNRENDVDSGGKSGFARALR
jgi:hypothetical protein